VREGTGRQVAGEEGEEGNPVRCQGGGGVDGSPRAGARRNGQRAGKVTKQHNKGT